MSIDRLPRSNGRTLWWGYLHINGTVRVKRFFDPGDTDEAKQSPFVLDVYGPLWCDNRADALKTIGDLLERAPNTGEKS